MRLVGRDFNYSSFFEFDAEGYAQGEVSGLYNGSFLPDILVRFGEPGRPLHVIGSFGAGADSSVVRIYNIFPVRGKVFTFFDNLSHSSVVLGAFIPGPDECPEDVLKDTPGVCGCGVKDLIDISNYQPAKCEVKNTDPEGSEEEVFLKTLTPKKPILSMFGNKLQISMKKMREFSYLITIKIMKGKKVKKTITLSSKRIIAYKKFKNGTKLKVSYVLIGKFFQSKVSREVGFKVHY